LAPAPALVLLALSNLVRRSDDLAKARNLELLAGSRHAKYNLTKAFVNLPCCICGKSAVKSVAKQIRGRICDKDSTANKDELHPICWAFHSLP